MNTVRTVSLQPLNAEDFAPFGDVIEAGSGLQTQINAARFERFSRLAAIDVDDNLDNLNVSVMRCATPSTLPLEFTLLERHPNGSQAFFPQTNLPYVAVVAPPAATPDPTQLKAFRCSPEQGINLHRGVWHLPLLGFAPGQSFFVVDNGADDNCDEVTMDVTVTLEGTL
ncbi:MAG: ureidoglycolate lyase [Pseudomonadota bacterium]